VLEEITLFIEELVALSRPSESIFLAIDGVAPRAKMMQRARCALQRVTLCGR